MVDNKELGNVEFQKGNYAKALNYYFEALDNSPPYSKHIILCNMAVTYLQLGENQQTLVYAKQSIDLKPDYFKAYLWQGSAYSNLHQYEHAEEAYVNGLIYDINNTKLVSGLQFVQKKIKEKNWEEFVDSQGNLYWQNKVTNEIVTKKPACLINAEPLPEFWEQRTDIKGNVYYVNHKTKKTQWDRPKANNPLEPVVSTYSINRGGSVNALPPNWEERFDGKGNKFYVNHSTKVTQWEKPKSLPTSNSNLKATPAENSIDPLPPNWEKKVDNRGNTYYVNHLTKKTQWVRPIPKVLAASTSQSFAKSSSSSFVNKTGSAERIRANRQGSTPLDKKLPAHWEEKVDKNGVSYYVNHFTKSTQWERPNQNMQTSSSTPASSSNITTKANITKSTSINITRPVECPMCYKKFHIDKIDQHANQCTGPQAQLKPKHTLQDDMKAHDDVTDLVQHSFSNDLHKKNKERLARQREEREEARQAQGESFKNNDLGAPIVSIKEQNFPVPESREFTYDDSKISIFDQKGKFETLDFAEYEPYVEKETRPPENRRHQMEQPQIYRFVPQVIPKKETTTKSMFLGQFEGPNKAIVKGANPEYGLSPVYGYGQWDGYVATEKERVKPKGPAKSATVLHTVHPKLSTEPVYSLNLNETSTRVPMFEQGFIPLRYTSSLDNSTDTYIQAKGPAGLAR